MTQIATVAAIGEDGQVQVTVARQTACGHDCENCAGCAGQAGSFTVTASTDIAVDVGDRVEIYSSRKILAVAALVYLVPVLLFLAGYVVTAGLTETLRYICAGIGFALGVGLAVVCDRSMRRHGAITYQIIRKL